MNIDIDRQGSHCVAQYARWAALWNGRLERSEQAIAERFVANLTADAATAPEDICTALHGWVQAIRSRVGAQRCLAPAAADQNALFVHPPSTRSAAPVVPDDSGLAM
jgi:hypothetical protein